MDGGTIGEVRIFAGNFAPRHWQFCQGQLLPINQNQALFSIIGTTYGGDGRTTFGLPDCRSRSVIGVGTGPGLSRYVEGQRGGVETVTLTQNQIPSHSHALTLSSVSAQVNAGIGTDDDSPAGNYPGSSGDIGENIYSSSKSTAMAADMIQISGTGEIGQTGGNLQHENRSPYLAMHYIICMQGIFPSRS